MNIFLLSMTDNLNPELKRALKNEIMKRGGRVAYISSSPQEGDKPYYISTIRDYKEIDEAIVVDYFDLSQNFSDEKLSTLAEYKIVYLSGGNTYIFLDSANKRSLRVILEKVLDGGGLLIGASAGSLMMTPTIELAKSENIISLKDSTGFNFVPFEFFPHYEAPNKGFPEEYITDNKIYCCKDGDGIFVSNGEITKFGDISEL